VLCVDNSILIGLLNLTFLVAAEFSVLLHAFSTFQELEQCWYFFAAGKQYVCVHRMANTAFVTCKKWTSVLSHTYGVCCNTHHMHKVCS